MWDRVENGELGGSLREGIDQGAGQQSGVCGTEAKVCSESEGDVRVWFAIKLNLVRVFENLFVTIGG